MVGRTLLLVTALPFLCLSVVNSELVTKCKSEDSKCLKESAQAFIPVFVKGLPEYNVKSLDPVTFKRIDASSPNLKFILSDIKVTGMKDCIAKKVMYSNTQSKNKLITKLLCNCQVDGQYELDGNLLIIPIKGKGPVHVTLRKLELVVDGEIGRIEKDGNTYLDIKDWKHSFALKDKSDVVFENLFDGNEVLAQAARDVISSSSNEVILEIGPKVVKTIATEVVNNIKNFFHSVPTQELSLD